MVCGNSESFYDPDTDDHYGQVILDYIRAWFPEDHDGHLPYPEIKDDLVIMFGRFPTLSVVSFDQFGATTVDLLRRDLQDRGQQTRVIEIVETQKLLRERATLFKTAAGLGWLHAYRDNYWNRYSLRVDQGSFLEQELRFLQIKDGKTVHQTSGPVKSKDFADAVMSVSVEILRDQLERLHLRQNLAQPLQYGLHKDARRTGVPAPDPGLLRRQRPQRPWRPGSGAAASGSGETSEARKNLIANARRNSGYGVRGRSWPSS